jgi:SAM-dependent methyltransferase
VLGVSASFPFDNESFDLAVSTSCFEHDQMFWLTFAELARVLRTGGYIYINTPSNGDYHSYPYDNWRFYPDAGLALEAWAGKLGLRLSLLESFTAPRKRDIWNDFVMV